MARPPELEKSGARENRDRGETRRSRASRIPPTAGFHRKNQADAEIRRWARIPALRLRLKTQTGSRTGLREGVSKARNEFVTTTLAQSPRFAFNAAIAHRRDSGGASSVTSRILSLGIAQTKRRNRSRPCHRLLAATCFTTRFAWR